MIKSTTLARPYAKAAFDYALENKKTEEWSTALHHLATVVKIPEMADVLRNPKFSHQQQMEILTASVKDLSTPVENFLQMLLHNHRMALLPAIYQLFDEYKAAAERTITVDVTSAFPLEEKQREQFAAAMSKRLNLNVHVNSKTDKTLIGGAVIRAGDQVIDGSVLGRLTQLADNLMNG